MMSIQEKILSILMSGRTLTTKQMAGLFATTEATIIARVADLRSEGYSIYNRTTKNGKPAYQLAPPSRSIVAAAYAALGSSIFRS